MAASVKGGWLKRAVLAAAAGALVWAEPASTVAAKPVNHALDWCPVSVDVRTLDSMNGLYSIRLASLDTGKASGTISLYAHDVRYDIPFSQAIVPGWGDRTTAPTPIVVRFPRPVDFDGAYVSSLDNPTPAPCATPFVPWIRYGSNHLPFGIVTTTDAAFERAAQAAVPVDAPPPVPDARPCETPDRRASTIHAAEPTYPREASSVSGTATVRVILNADDSVYGVLLERSTQNDALDRSALVAARNSRYLGATFRCKPTVGVYLFLVSFGPR
jgi:TonB family protein